MSYFGYISLHFIGGHQEMMSSKKNDETRKRDSDSTWRIFRWNISWGNKTFREERDRISRYLVRREHRQRKISHENKADDALTSLARLKTRQNFWWRRDSLRQREGKRMSSEQSVQNERMNLRSIENPLWFCVLSQILTMSSKMRFFVVLYPCCLRVFFRIKIWIMLS